MLKQEQTSDWILVVLVQSFGQINNWQCGCTKILMTQFESQYFAQQASYLGLVQYFLFTRYPWKPFQSLWTVWIKTPWTKSLIIYHYNHAKRHFVVKMCRKHWKGVGSRQRFRTLNLFLVSAKSVLMKSMFVASQTFSR